MQGGNRYDEYFEVHQDRQQFSVHIFEFQFYNQGDVSYRDAKTFLESKKALKVGKGTDLTQHVIRSIRELGRGEGASLKEIETHLKEMYTIDISGDSNFALVVRLQSGSITVCNYTRLVS